MLNKRGAAYLLQEILLEVGCIPTCTYSKFSTKILDLT